LHAARTLLERLMHAAEAGGRSGAIIEAAILHALAYQAQDELDTSLMWLSRALALAEPEGYVQVFVDEGPALAPLLARSLSRGTHPASVLTCSPNVNQLPLSSLNTHLNRVQEVLLVILARFLPFV
jgi:LuxR family maltose regulon positive regulatory protein